MLAKLFVGLLVLCAMTAGCSWKSKPNEIDPVEILGNFSLRGNVWDQEAAWPLAGALHRLAPEHFKSADYIRPACVLAFGTTGEPIQFLIVEDAGVSIHPGNNFIRLTLLDESGRIRTSATCRVCGDFVQAHHHIVEGFDQPVFAIESVRHCQPPFVTQWYALSHDRFDLIRIDDPEWGLIQNDYLDGYRFFGPKPPKQSADQWEADLCSNDRLRNLRSLFWLNGNHGSKIGAGFDRIPSKIRLTPQSPLN